MYQPPHSNNTNKLDMVYQERNQNKSFWFERKPTQSENYGINVRMIPPIFVLPYVVQKLV